MRDVFQRRRETHVFQCLTGGGVPRVPDTVARQLAEGGRLVAVTGEDAMRGTLMTRSRGILSSRPVFDAATPVLPELAVQPGFVF